MSILIDENTKVVIQGAGKAGQFHMRQMIEYGTNVVAAVKPGAGGTTLEPGVPVFHTLKGAVEATGCNASAIFVPALRELDDLPEEGGRMFLRVFTLLGLAVAGWRMRAG